MKTRYLIIWGATVFMVFMAFGSQGVFAGDSVNELFSDAPGFKQVKAEQDPIIIRSRNVVVNFYNLVKKEAPRGVDKIILNLFSDASFTAVKERLEKRLETRGLDRYTWFGSIEGVEHSQVILTVENRGMAGNITLDGQIYQIRDMGDGIHAVREINQCAFPDELPPTPVEVEPDRLDVPEDTMLDDGSIIDIMVVYTQDAAAASANIAAEIQLAMDETNQGYANSGINPRMRLVHKAQVSYTESGNIVTDRNRLQNPTDGYMDNVHPLRDTYAADMVSLWVENGGGYCGIAYIMTTVSTSFENYAFQVTARSCATGYYSFGHEFGHIQSARHDWYVDWTNNSPYTYNHGYVYLPGRWRTVMAYNTECSNNGTSCTRLLYWSNPDVMYGGVPMGVPEGQYHAADNRKTLNNTAYTVANFRQSTAAPVADIKADGSDGPVTITPSDTLSVTVELDSGDSLGDNADWWVLADSPLGWYYYDVNSDSWFPGQIVTYQGPLFDLNPYEVLNMSGLPLGDYTFYFGVDMNMNGSIDIGQLYYDGVGVTVTH